MMYEIDFFSSIMPSWKLALGVILKKLVRVLKSRMLMESSPVALQRARHMISSSSI